YYAVGELGLDGGFTVTASHNPKEYTGMKVVRRDALPVGGESGLLDVRDKALAEAWPEAGSPGTIEPVDIWPGFVDKVMSFVDVGAIEPLRVVIDAANGMGGAMLPPVPETIRRAGGVPLVNRVGHAFIKHRMRKEDAVFAGEVSGHYYFRDFYRADSGVIPFLLMLEYVSGTGRKLSEILKPYRETYFITVEI